MSPAPRVVGVALAATGQVRGLRLPGQVSHLGSHPHPDSDRGTGHGVAPLALFLQLPVDRSPVREVPACSFCRGTGPRRVHRHAGERSTSLVYAVISFFIAAASSCSEPEAWMAV